MLARTSALLSFFWASTIMHHANAFTNKGIYVQIHLGGAYDCFRDDQAPECWSNICRDKSWKDATVNELKPVYFEEAQPFATAECSADGQDWTEEVRAAGNFKKYVP
ncbi:hypothetical protein CBOM_01697 [Ceraceosorus bombacis]|uniref:Uncharacterized protein n=1 Tax=Ceraceosorus bombacis TaxID=401625 RepID=A0A0P1BD11_9BASI|nr:hypothetical protein CBOM_01697 [Ceraceosorus bombacis]